MFTVVFKMYKIMLENERSWENVDKTIKMIIEINK